MWYHTQLFYLTLTSTLRKKEYRQLFHLIQAWHDTGLLPLVFSEFAELLFRSSWSLFVADFSKSLEKKSFSEERSAVVESFSEPAVANMSAIGEPEVGVGEPEEDVLLLSDDELRAANELVHCMGGSGRWPTGGGSWYLEPPKGFGTAAALSAPSTWTGDEYFLLLVWLLGECSYLLGELCCCGAHDGILFAKRDLGDALLSLLLLLLVLLWAFAEIGENEKACWLGEKEVL